jgi:YggT family protein
MGLIRTALMIYVYILVATALLSWFPSNGGPLDAIKSVLRKITEPVIAPVRKALPSTGGVDFSVMLVTIVLLFIARTI